MVTPRAWLGASRRLILSFVLVLLVPAAAVVWLGVRLIEQDRALASRQLRERRESAADRLTARLEQAVSSTERRLDGDPTRLPIQPDDDAVVVTLRPDGIEAYPRDHLLYVPAIPPGPAEPTAAFEDANFAPTWSCDGEYLAYYSFRDLSIATSIRVLVIRSAKTGEERTVPLQARVASLFAAGPKWFPDNRSVLVLSGDAQGSGSGFYRLALDTGNTELLAHLPEDVSSYDLSPDGRTIIYAFETVGTGRLMRFDIESQRETELRNDLWCVSLAISPDGLQVATTLGGGVVEVTPAAGGQSREVFRPAVPFGTGELRQALAWTPDQRFLLFVQEDGALWKVPALGGEAEKVGISMGGIKSPAVRPDGKQIVFGAATGGGTREVWALENFLPALRAKK